MKKYSKKALDKRKEERVNFPEFFQKHINIIISERRRCEECGAPLKGDVSEVAHILSKSTFKSISTEDSNIIYLCGWQSTNNCHSKFDNSSNDVVKQMNIFDKICESFENLLPLLTEKINYKINDRYTK